MSYTKEEALDYHRKGRKGKIEITPTKPLTTQHHLSLAYSPGVAEAVQAIADDEMEVFEMTAKGNLVAVVSNGSAILGMGNLGPMASKPVMEGKGVLFKRFADIDVFDIEINAETVEEMVAVIKALEPTFGGINLEDIKAPEAFAVESILKEEMNIPVFHDDQHGTAIISGAALLNACDLTDRDLADVQVVISGAGASAIATAKFYVSLGVRRENILMFDSSGLIYEGRERVNRYKAEFATARGDMTMQEALEGADMLLGLSVAGAVDAEWLAGMKDEPMLFMLANPVPEIMPEEALAVRPDAIIATGRSDYPNQVNNVLGFPFIFRGALDTSATGVNEAMKVAAAEALAELARQDVPDSVLAAYGVKSLTFGQEYLIPKPFDPRVLLWVSPAVARAAIESGVARRHIDIDAYIDELFARLGRGTQFRNEVLNRALETEPKRVVFPEGTEPKIIRAAYQTVEDGIAEPVLLGNEATIRALIEELALDFAPEIIDPTISEQRSTYAEALYHLRQRKGMRHALAEATLRDPINFGLMMVQTGDADAFLGGVTTEYPEVLRPALQIVGTKDGVTKAAGLYILIVNRRVYLFADCTVNIEPDAADLAEVAMLAADFARNDLGLEPRVAMLSFSNFGSAPHPRSKKVSEAVQIVKELRPDLTVDGEMQADTAVVDAIIEERFPFSQVRNPNVLIFPDLSSGNIAYKLLSHLGGAEVIGPVLLGMAAPVQVLQAGDEVEEIVAMTAIATTEQASTPITEEA